jgi:hypothetical protein
MPTGFRPQLKAGRTSAPRLPQAFADEARLDIGQPHVIGPAVCAEGNGVAAIVVGAINEDPRTPMSRMSPKVVFGGAWRYPSGALAGEQIIDSW